MERLGNDFLFLYDAVRLCFIVQLVRDTQNDFSEVYSGAPWVWFSVLLCLNFVYYK